MLKSLIPVRYHYALANLKRSLFERGKKDTYSQFGEDTFVSSLLKGESGFYVDVGAHHPTRYSNTKLFFDRGWRGVNIDPNPDTIHLFNRARPKDINICSAIGKEGGELTYYRFSDPAVNTLDPEEAEKWKGKKWLEFLGNASVPVKTLSEVLSSIENLPTIDLMSVDTEGFDLAVLESNDWQRFSPKVIVVESHGFDSAYPESNDIFRFLSKKGYILKGTCGPSLIFACE